VTDTHTSDPAAHEPGAPALRGREHELTQLSALIARAAAGRSGALVVHGEAGIGKTALLDAAARDAPDDVRIRRMVASESEIELAYAALQQLCGPMLESAAPLPAPQREALEAALGLRVAAAPSPFLVGLAVLGLLTEHAGGRPLVCIIDDAQWLDEVSARALAFVARRLDAEGIVIVLAMREVAEPFSDLRRLEVHGLGNEDARALFRRAVPATIDPRVRDQLIAEARGNPLALQELPRALTPAEIAGGFAVAGSLPLESRIEQSLIAQLAPLAASTRLMLLVAAAEPTGDPDLLWRASAALGLGSEDIDAAVHAGALSVGVRVNFRHPLVRSAVYRAASPEERRRVHAALADATSAEQDPDRRAWHRASATLLPDEGVALDLERSATRARTRGGAAAAAAFLERAAELSPSPERRAQRLIAAAEAKHDAGAFEAALRLLDTARDQPLSALQEALIVRLRVRAGYALRRDRSGPQLLLAAAQGLETLHPVLARDTYLEALAAAFAGGRLCAPGETSAVATAILAATADDASDRALDLMLRGQALLYLEGQAAAAPTLQRALRAFLDQPPDALDLRWMWFGCHAARDLWDADSLRAIAMRQADLARAGGVLTVLPIALTFQMTAWVLDGRLDRLPAACDEVDAIQNVTGHPLPQYGRMNLAAYRGRVEEVERRATLIRADAHARGEGHALSVANFALATVYNGAGRYQEAVAAARGEMPYTRELAFAMRALPELVEAATRIGEASLAQDAVRSLATVTEPVGGDYALATLALARAQLQAGEEAEALYQEAIERFDRARLPLLLARAQLVYGEALRRQQRRIDAREQLRAAYEGLSRGGMDGFAERAARELRATGETLRVRTPESMDQLTDQERNVARLAGEGLTNRDIGARLFISARTAEYHLHKVFLKLGISSRAELKSALSGHAMD
jgi:DNA-binding CsgD family transcriptional regulator